ncbi:hypothetical protein FOQG_08772 [Fusarium oxysporum f. sp. raphani 54005]|uniref:Uncharacterized protein n=2 Tax=Fusarium oxysporum f. sp. raphani TaxID=96318 RepID=X0CAM5_FUSOX|nr:hypothetical protein FOQG_08772 [Fusarium oxysporum f. sp. raphani 54005]KAG7432270.1 Cytochrome P450 monooxygenase BOT1 [Fusarium oxysporum f. sp. raphani]
MPERHQNGVYTDETGRQTVFDAILDAEPDRSTKGLVDEAFSLVIGGTETTVTTITYGVWCILKNPNVEKKMLEELRTVETNSDGLMEYQNLMNLPYQTAVIHETLHISSPSSWHPDTSCAIWRNKIWEPLPPCRYFRLNSAAFNPLRPNPLPGARDLHARMMARQQRQGLQEESDSIQQRAAYVCEIELVLHGSLCLPREPHSTIRPELA